MILAAVQWLEGALLGTIATTVAIIAVASLGFMALTGRLPLRRALTVIGGCFLVFGASSIAGGIERAVRQQDVSMPVQRQPNDEVSPLATLPPQSAGYDPYAGAAVPSR